MVTIPSHGWFMTLHTSTLTDFKPPDVPAKVPQSVPGVLTALTELQSNSTEAPMR